MPGWRNGRRYRLKICWPIGRVGSSPTPGTTNKEPDVKTSGDFVCCPEWDSKVSSGTISAEMVE